MTRPFTPHNPGLYARASGYCKNNQLGSVTSPLAGTVNGFSYSAGWAVVSGSTIKVTSTGSLSGSVSSGYSLTESITPPSVSTPGMCAGGSNGNISGAMTVTGDLQCVKSINGGNSLSVTGNLTMGAALNGSPTVGKALAVAGDCNGTPTVGGNMTVTGNLNSSPKVGGNLVVDGVDNGHPTVTGTTTTHGTATVSVSAPPVVSTMATTLESTAGLTLNSPSSITVLDFTSSPNGVIYIHGDANISGTVTVIGSGTVVVSGNWNQSSRFPATGTAAVSVVCPNDLNISGGIYISGSLYSGADWNESGNFAIGGVVVVDADENVSGSGSVSDTGVPSFDSRGGGSATTTVANFTGPQP